MMYEYGLAGKGLRTMYIGEVVSLCSLVAVFLVPALGLIGVLIGGIMILMGQNRAGPAHDGYRTAMVLFVVNIVINILKFCTGNSPFTDVLDIIGNIISCAETYYICRASSELLSAKGDYELAGRAEEIWKVSVGCYVVSVVCVLVAWIPIVNIAALITIILSAVVSIVVAFMLIDFYNKASKALLDE